MDGYQSMFVIPCHKVWVGIVTQNISFIYQRLAGFDLFVDTDERPIKVCNKDCLTTSVLYLSPTIFHAREPLYSNSAVIAWCSQSTGTQNVLFRFTVIHSMSQYFTAFNFHNVFVIWKYSLGIVVHSGPIRAFKF